VDVKSFYSISVWAFFLIAKSWIVFFSVDPKVCICLFQCWAHLNRLYNRLKLHFYSSKVMTLLFTIKHITVDTCSDNRTVNEVVVNLACKLTI
jgi:hypothetical protein